MSNVDHPSPPLAKLVGLGEGAALQRVNEFIWISPDVSNAHLVNTADGHVLVNAGTVTGAARHAALFDTVATGPRAYIFVTQHHPDHVGGSVALRQPQTRVVAEKSLPAGLRHHNRLAPAANERTFKLWEPLLGPGMRKLAHFPQLQVDVLVDDHLTLMVGGRRFDLLHVPGGETTDSLAVHLPDEGIVFTGNLFGPAWNCQPNLYTIRGDRIRSAESYLSSLDRVRALEPETLITGHGEPVRGRATIQSTLGRMREAVQGLHDRTLEGILAGKSLQQLMAEIEVPKSLGVGQLHGKTSWNVRAIWTEYLGWFEYRSTTELYPVLHTAVATDLVELAGGAAPLVGRADRHLAAGKPLHALHLLEHVLEGEPGHREALLAKRRALQQLLGDGLENLSETMWLRAEILAVNRTLGDA